MQLYALLAIIIGWVASLGLTGWKAYDFGQSACQLKVVQAAQQFNQRRKRFNARIDDRQKTRAQNRADREENLNDKYEDALDVIGMYDLQLGKKDCKIPAPVREAIGKIR